MITRTVPAWPRLALLLVLVSLLVLTSAPVRLTATASSSVALTVEGSPFNPNGDGRRESISIELSLPGPAIVDLRIHDFDGRRIKTLARDASHAAGLHRWTWKGRDTKGRKVPFGPYRVKATVTIDGATFKRARWITRATRVPYPIRPGAVVVALDPGHGGPAAGAVWRRLKEDAINLDIGLRLEAMLKGAGIIVVMTRRTDRNVSPVGKDLNGDGKYSRVDELIARNDVANEARADIHFAMHNNASTCHCTRGTEMYTHDGRGWSPEGRRLARLLLDEHIKLLKRLPGYSPRRRGVKFHAFKALKPFHAKFMPRPSLQPSVLGESLFLDRPSEHRILSKRSGRTVLAAAYFDGISRYLAWRPYGLGYRVLEAPKSVAPGAKVSTRVRLTNTGHRTSDGWWLTARVVAKVPRYDGRPRRGAIVASLPIPDDLGPGESIDLVLSGIPLPAKAGQWLVKLDVRLRGDDFLSRHGVVGPQLSVRTVDP